MTPTLDRRFFRAAVIYAVFGMGAGIYMAASHDHSLAPAHAHFLLLGWVSMFLYGAFYKLHPAVQGALAAWQWWIANIGVIVMVTGIALIVTGSPERGEPFAAIGALINITGMILFAVNVFRGTRA
jgi:cbb3-type cytochrome oxidase subunit 1